MGTRRPPRCAIGMAAALRCRWPRAASGSSQNNLTVPRRAHPVLPAVDRERGAGDEVRVVGGEEVDTARDVLRGAEAAARDAGDDLLQHLPRHGAHHLGVHVAGRDGVDDDLAFRALLSEGLGEAVDAGLSGGVVHLAHLPGLAVHRADVDDAPELAGHHAATPAHMGRCSVKQTNHRLIGRSPASASKRCPGLSPSLSWQCRTRTTSHSAGAHGSRTTIPLTAGRGSGGRDHSCEAALEAMLAFGSPIWIRQDLIRVLPNEDAMI